MKERVGHTWYDQHPCLSFCWCDKTPWPKESRGGKGFFGVHVYTVVHCWRESAQELKQGRSWCRGHRGVLPPDLLPRACSTCFLIELRATCPGVESWHKIVRPTCDPASQRIPPNRLHSVCISVSPHYSLPLTVVSPLFNIHCQLTDPAVFLVPHLSPSFLLFLSILSLSIFFPKDAGWPELWGLSVSAFWVLGLFYGIWWHFFTLLFILSSFFIFPPLFVWTVPLSMFPFSTLYQPNANQWSYSAFGFLLTHSHSSQ